MIEKKMKINSDENKIVYTNLVQLIFSMNYSF
jgi:hypothetical protein